ncbi:MAG TPA: hypothetical protein VNL77_01200 [Roseiflexaceae bacterium]|nr:hypothetical protein [Roseiflexaceae bacterium]
MTERPPRPRWTGIDTYIDPHGRYTFRFPSDWYRFELDPGVEGVMFSPEPSEPQTYLSSWIRKLETHVVAEDLPVLRGGVAEGLSQLPGCAVESEQDGTYGNLIKFERVFTFRDGQAVRKRKIWILYVDYWQIVLTYQGSSPEEWEYWLPMGNYAFFHFNIPPELWFATDRDLNKPGEAQAKARVPRGRNGKA